MRASLKILLLIESLRQERYRQSTPRLMQITKKLNKKSGDKSDANKKKVI